MLCHWAEIQTTNQTGALSMKVEMGSNPSLLEVRCVVMKKQLSGLLFLKAVKVFLAGHISYQQSHVV